MSKDFEKEYIELAQNEIPDLWNRIEAGLSEKSTPEKLITTPEKGGQNKTPNLVYLKRYAGLAAAILCVALIVPASKLIRQSEGYSSSTDAVASSEAYDTAAEAEACEEAFDTAASEEAYDTANSAAEAAEAETAESAEAAEVTEATTEMYDLSEEDAAAGAAAKEAVIAESGSSYDADGDAMDDLMSANEERKQSESSIIKNVIVQVTEENNDVYGKDGKALGGTVYTVIVYEDASGTLKEGEQIEVYLSVNSSMRMSVGEKFNIDISCETDGEYQYVVDKIYLKEE